MNTFTRLAEELKGYLLSKEPFHTYATDIEVHVDENTEDLECKHGCNGIDRLIKEIPFSDFQNNIYSFSDKFLDNDVPYIYRVEALDSTGKVIGVSNEETI